MPVLPALPTLPPRKVGIVQPATCEEYLSAMAAVRQACAEEGTVPLYHYTMLAAAPFILGGGFRMSAQGQGDGGKADFPSSRVHSLLYANF